MRPLSYKPYSPVVLPGIDGDAVHHEGWQRTDGFSSVRLPDMVAGLTPPLNQNVKIWAGPQTLLEQGACAAELRIIQGEIPWPLPVDEIREKLSPFFKRHSLLRQAQTPEADQKVLRYFPNLESVSGNAENRIVKTLDSPGGEKIHVGNLGEAFTHNNLFQMLLNAYLKGDRPAAIYMDIYQGDLPTPHVLRVLVSRNGEAARFIVSFQTDVLNPALVSLVTSVAQRALIEFNIYYQNQSRGQNRLALESVEELDFIESLPENHEVDDEDFEHDEDLEAIEPEGDLFPEPDEENYSGVHSSGKLSEPLVEILEEDDLPTDQGDYPRSRG